MTFEQWWDSEARTPAPDTYKNWEVSCRLAWIAAQEASQPDASAKTWCEYVAGMVGCYLGEPVESDKCKAIAAIIARRLWALPSPGQPIAVINAKGAEQCNHSNTRVEWDYVACVDCGAVKMDGAGNGWHKSMQASISAKGK